MGENIEKLIAQLSERMAMFRESQQHSTDDISWRDYLMLEILDGRELSISEISSHFPRLSDSTISTAITRLWRNKKLVSKTIDPDNQRVTRVALTAKGKQALADFRKLRAERLDVLMKALGMNDEEKQVLIRVMNRAIEYFDKQILLKK